MIKSAGTERVRGDSGRHPLRAKHSLRSVYN
jgi:hypothetical protein